MKELPQVEGNKLVTTRPFIVTIRKKEKWADPRELQIDVDPDWVNTSKHPDKSIHSDRVMPFIDFGKFCTLLKGKTKTFKAVNDSHFWVSGYYALHFYLKSAKDRLKIKKFVKEAVVESGGFMKFENWYEQHNKKHTRIIQFNGTGSSITKTSDNLSVAFL